MRALYRRNPSLTRGLIAFIAFVAFISGAAATASLAAADAPAMQTAEQEADSA